MAEWKSREHIDLVSYFATSSPLRILQPRPSHRHSAVNGICKLPEHCRRGVYIGLLAPDTYSGNQLVSYKATATAANIQRSTTLTSTLTPPRLSRNFNPHSGFSFGFDPADAASKMTWETAQTISEMELTIPQAPSAGV